MVGWKKIAALETFARGARTTRKDFVAFRARDTDVGRDLVERCWIDEGPNIGVWVEPGAQTKCVRPFDQSLEESVVNRLVQEQAAGCRAALTRSTEGTPKHAIQRQLEVGVCQYDLGILAPHLEGEPLVHAPTGLADLRTDRGGAGKRDDRTGWVLDQRGTGFLTAAVHELKGVISPATPMGRR
jgi:hypothetical protein